MHDDIQGAIIDLLTKIEAHPKVFVSKYNCDVSLQDVRFKRHEYEYSYGTGEFHTTVYDIEEEIYAKRSLTSSMCEFKVRFD